MYTYVEVFNGRSTEYFYAFIGFSNGILTLQSPQGLGRIIERKLSVHAIHELTKDEHMGGQRISFLTEEERYTFYECGPGVVNYLQENLFV